VLGHKTRFGALGTQNIGAVGDETFAHQRALALGAQKTVVVPVPVLERDELGATDSCVSVSFHIQGVS